MFTLLDLAGISNDEFQRSDSVRRPAGLLTFTVPTMSEAVPGVLPHTASVTDRNATNIPTDIPLAAKYAVIMFSFRWFLNATAVLHFCVRLVDAHPSSPPPQQTLPETDGSRGNSSSPWITVRVPAVVHVRMKYTRKDNAPRKSTEMEYVDHVYAPSYREVRMRPEKYAAELECAAIRVRVVTHRCDCRDVCRNRWPPSSRHPTATDSSVNDCTLSIYADGNADGPLYFSASADDGHVPRTPFRARVNAAEHFGPIRRDGLGHTRPQQLLDERSFREWTSYVSQPVYGQFVWIRRDVVTSESANRRGDAIVITLAGNRSVSFDRNRCFDVPYDENRLLFTSDLKVNEGGCVRAYEGPGCTGTSRIVVQARVRLFSDGGDAETRPAFGVRSLASCCRQNRPDQSRFDRRNSSRMEDDVRRGSRSVAVKCSCSCPNQTAGSGTPAPSADFREGRGRLAVESPPRPGEFFELESTGAANTDLALERSVAVMLADTPDDRKSAAVAAGMAATMVARVTARTLALMDSMDPGLLLRGAYGNVNMKRLLNETAESTVDSALEAIKATPDNAAELALQTALDSTCAQAFVNVVGDSLRLDELEKNRLAKPAGTIEDRNKGQIMVGDAKGRKPR